MATKQKKGKAAVSQLRSAILTGLKEEVEVTVDPMDLGQWIRMYRRMLAPSRPLDWEQHKYLLPLINDHAIKDREPAREVVLMKAGQVGVSELMLSYALWSCDQRKGTVLYLFPSEKLISDFSAERLQPAIDVSTHLAAIVKGGTATGGTNRVTLKRVGDRHLYLRGTKVDTDGDAAQLKSVAADVIVFDEVDSMDMRALPLAEKRLGHSTIGEQRFVSTPSYTDRGIHQLYLDSDQRVCLYKCSGCNHWNEVTLERIIIEKDASERPITWFKDEDGYPVPTCEKCVKPIRRTEEFEWVARHPTVARVGYHLTKFVTPFARLDDVISRLRSNDQDEVRQSMNQDVGVPYTPRGAGLTDQSLKEKQRDYGLRDPEGFMYMGVDIGTYHNVVIRDSADRLVWAEEADSMFRVGQLIYEFDPMTVVVDGMPETEGARTLQAEFTPGKVWLCYYNHQMGKRRQPWEFQAGKLKRVSADRLRLMDRVVGGFGPEGSLTLPRDISVIDNYAKQMTIPVRVVETDHTNNRMAMWVGKPDHYFQAEVYCMLAKLRPDWDWAAGLSGYAEAMRTENASLWQKGMA